MKLICLLYLKLENMDNILLLDTSVASLNKGDDIIMECVRKELEFIFDKNFELTLPTHVSSFHWYQIYRGLARIQKYSNCKYKFVGGTNLLVKDMATYYPQWNINIFNSKAIRNCILVGVGAGAGEKTNFYTSFLYRKTLNTKFYHSVRDLRTKQYVESLGLKALNTGCVTMWMLTPDFCKTIPSKKSDRVVFTLTASDIIDPLDQSFIDTLIKSYKKIYFWPQGDMDYKYLHKFNHIEDIIILQTTKQAYQNLLLEDDIEYVGTRLHAGIYAMRHAKRSIILVIDERAREINESNNLNCLEKKDIFQLNNFINSEFETKIRMPLKAIEMWKNQF